MSLSESNGSKTLIWIYCWNYLQHGLVPSHPSPVVSLPGSPPWSSVVLVSSAAAAWCSSPPGWLEELGSAEALEFNQILTQLSAAWGSQRKRRDVRRRTYFCTRRARGSATLPGSLTGHRLLLSSQSAIFLEGGSFSSSRSADVQRAAHFFFFPRTRCLPWRLRRATSASHF